MASLDRDLFEAEKARQDERFLVLESRIKEVENAVRKASDTHHELSGTVRDLRWLMIVLVVMSSPQLVTSIGTILKLVKP